IVVDGDGDKKTWYWRDHKNYATFNGDTNSGFILSLFRSSSSHGDDNQADFLITRSPVRLPAGKGYVGFHFAGKMAGFSDSLCVYHGKSSDANLASLTYIGSIVNSTKGWKHQVLTFDIPSDGEYYFHFVNRSRADQFGIWLDNIEIGTGVFRGGEPDLSVDRVVLPSSACGLGNAEKIGVQLTNIGLTAVTAVKLTYAIDDAAPVTQTFDRTIGISETVFLDFEKKADLSVPDKMYTVAVTAEVVACASEETEVRTADNAGTGRVTHFTPGELPFEADLRTEEGLARMGYGSAYWVRVEGDTNGLNGVQADAPLTTRCMTLDADAEYRLFLRYKAGDVFGSAILPTDFEILYGLSGTPILTWRTLKAYTNETGYTGEGLGEDEFTFENEWAGDYSFAIVPKADMLGNYNGSLYIAELRIESLREHDVKLAMVQPSIGVLTPAQHAVSPRFNVSVVNRGRESENVNITVSMGETRIGSSKTAAVKVGDTAYYTFGGTMTRPEAGGKVTLTFDAGMEGVTDEYPADNRCEWTFTATEDVYAYDDVTIETYEDGIGLQGCPFGHIFTLAEQDTLTAVTFGWFNLSGAVVAGFKAGIEVYAMGDDEKVGACVLSERFERQLVGGLQTVELPARV
ncbi:MAG: hypothetical protein K2O01_01445, partial [Bacteroidales bacterium]|nr:hypothetical protein [Bacteroidales bacterium]